MPRQKRYRIPDIPQHVIARGNDRKACFFNPSDYCSYLKLLGEASAKHGCEVHAYVLMTNHVHLLMTPRKPDALSRTMQAVGRRYVQQINALYRRTGTLWEGRYKATVVASEDYLLWCYRYIELNPVRAGMVPEPGAYPWSSYRHNALGREDRVVCEQEAYLSLGRTAEIRQAAYRELFREVITDEKLDQIRDSTRMGRPLGNDRFKAEIEAMLRCRVSCNTWGGARPGSGRRPIGSA
jgi:putative transposase